MTDNAQAILTDDRLDTGMSAREALTRARLWWDAKGRHLLAKMHGKDPAFAAVSGIIAAHAFDRLTRREQVAIVKVWHHFNVRRPDLLDVAAGAAFKLGGGERVQ